MIFLARFILRGYSQAALVAAVMAMLGLLLPPVAWVSGASIALTTLAKGYRQGLIVMAIAGVGAAAFSLLVFSLPQVAFVFVLLIWLPVWGMAAVLRQTVSLALSIQLIAALCLVGVAVLYLLFPAFGEFWRPSLDVMVQQLAETNTQLSEADWQALEDRLIMMLPGLFASSLMVGAMLSLFLARWWQAVLYNPGGFGKEFRSLDLGKTSAVIAFVIAMAAIATGASVLNAMLLIVFALYLNQGIAVLHAIFAGRQLNAVWLFLVYVLMFLIPHIVVLLAVAGMADTWIDFRRRLTA